MKRTLLFTSCLLVAACAVELVPDPPADPRVGEQGHVRFTGGGCTGSTALAVGSRETMRLEAVSEPLPDDLETRSTAPEVIAVTATDVSNEIDFVAERAGASRIEVMHAGAPFDALTFRAEPARGARSEHVPHVFVGGTFDIVVTEVYGACGTKDCPLFGHSFLRWRSEPPSTLALLADTRGTASFRADAEGSADVWGQEPGEGNDIVLAAVEVVPIEGITGLAATLTTIPLAEGEESVSLALPGTVQAGKAFCVRLDAERDGALAVPLSRRDVRWRIDGEAISAVPMEHESEPLGTVFLAAGRPGAVTLTAEVDLLDADATFALDVAP